MVLTRAGLQQVCWGVLAGAAGGEAEGVEEDLSLHAEHHQLVVEVLLPALGDLAGPGPATLVMSPLTLAHPHHMLVLSVLLGQVVHDEPPLQVGVAGGPGPDEGL